VKKLSKKLTLNRETVASLELAQGGISALSVVCNPTELGCGLSRNIVSCLILCLP
jgi:hypothetical protein